MASAVEAGRQAALMAPTEILARQHYERLVPLAGAMRLRLLTGRDRAAERRATAASSLPITRAEVPLGAPVSFVY